MADTFIWVPSPQATKQKLLLHDNGDGTFSLATYDGSSGSTNTEYTEGATDATITGIAFMWEDAADTLRAVSVTKPLPVTLATNINSTDDSITTIAGASELHGMQVGGTTAVATGTFNRTNDTNNYAANDTVSDSTSATTPISITGAARVSGGSGIILPGGRLVQGSTVANASGYRLWLYISSPASPPNDNAAFTITNANNGARLQFIDFVQQKTGTDIIEFYATEKYVAFDLASGTTLYGLLETLGAITTPTASTTYTVYLPVMQN